LPTCAACSKPAGRAWMMSSRSPSSSPTWRTSRRWSSCAASSSPRHIPPIRSRRSRRSTIRRLSLRSRRSRRSGMEREMDNQQPSVSEPEFQSDADALFAPLRIGTLRLSNRLAVAPMTRVSANEEGLPTKRMAGYYSGFARGGFGLVITEGLYTDEAFSQGYRFQPGLANDAHRDGWRPLVASVQAQGAGFIAQLMHAGALSQDNRY